MINFGFIGCGHMGSILAEAVSKTETDLALSDANIESVTKLAEKINASVIGNQIIANEAKYIVIGVKPQNLDELLTSFAPVIQARYNKPVIISMCAGVKIEKLESYLGKSTPIIRIMPNTPAAVGQGMIVYSANDVVTEVQKKAFEKAFDKAGEIAEIEEDFIDAASAVHGCGPAFVYMFIIALAKAGENIGLEKGMALKLAKATVRGAGSLACESEKDPATLRDEVCSPGGSTIEGVRYLATTDFEDEVAKTVLASYERTKELG